MAKLNMIQAINLALKEEMRDDERVVVLGQDVGEDEGVFRATIDLNTEFGNDRVIDTPLAENGIIGTAIGMAIGGLKPVAEMQFSGFSYLMIPQLENHASRYRSRTHGQFTVPLVVRMPFGGGIRALEHHSESREVFYAAIPGVKTVIPSGPRNARSLLKASIRDPDPVVFMEPKRSYRAFREEVPDDPEVMELGKCQLLQPGEDLTVISFGATMRQTLQAVESVQNKREASIEVLDLVTISPIDAETIAQSVKKTGRCVIVQEAPRSFSVSSEIIALINDRVLLYLEAPIKRVTHFDVVTPAFARENDYLPTADQVERALLETLDF